MTPSEGNAALMDVKEPVLSFFDYRSIMHEESLHSQK